MTDNDDKLLKQFFSNQKQEIADNGFSRRVMRGLPGRATQLASVLTSICVILSAIIFILFDGFNAILRVFREIIVATVQNGALNLDIKALAIAGAVLLFLGVRKIYTME